MDAVGEILFEILIEPVREQILRDEPERTAENQSGADLIRQSNAWLKIVQIPLRQRSLGMRDRAFPAADGIGRIRIELQLEPILRVERRFVAPTQSKIQRDVLP